MTPPKYNFYIGSTISIYFGAGMTIDSVGNIINGSSTQYASSTYALDKNKSVYINLTSLDYSNAIFFYNKSKNFIGYELLNNFNNAVIQAPSDAAYFALRFSANDANFIAKKDTNFVYILSVVNPHYKDLSKKYSKENGQEFFRESLDGKINLFGEDYELISGESIESIFTFIITKYSETRKVWNLYYIGKFSKVDCKFDHSRKKCELKMTPVDSYTEILKHYEDKFDIIKDLKPVITPVTMQKRILLQLYILGSSKIFNCIGNQYWESDTTTTIDSSTVQDLYTKYAFSPVDAASEIAVYGSNIVGVNGMYAGTGLTLWHESNNFKIEISDVNKAIGLAALKLMDSSGSVLYTSQRNVPVGFNVFSVTEDFDLNKHTYLQTTEANITLEGTSGTAIAYNAVGYAIYSRILCDIDIVDGTFTHNIPNDDISQEIYAYKKMIGLSANFTIFCKAYYTQEPTEYGLNDYGVYFSNEFLPASSGLTNPLPISRSAWVNASLWLVYDYGFASFEESLRTQSTLKNAYYISDVISALLSKINPEIHHSNSSGYSAFLYANSMPSIFTNNRFHLFITPISNVIKGDYDDSAKKGEISLKMIMDMLRDCFKCYWYIDNNNFIIEHIYYFMNGLRYSTNTSSKHDITTLKDAFNKKYIEYFQAEIEYDKSDLPSRYEMAWQNNSTEAFGNFYVDVESNYIQDSKVETINVSNFSADIDYIQFNPSDVSSDGFVLIGAVLSGNSFIVPIGDVTMIKDKYSYNATISNVYLSWPKLIEYYMFDLPAYNITCNKIQYLQSRGLKRFMKHTVKICLEEDITTNKQIHTNLGDGNINEISINLNTRIATIQLSYKPE